MADQGLLPTHWYYNTESGQLTQGNNLENLGNNLVGGAGWHELNIPGNATADQAAAEAKKEFPNGKTPTNAGITPARVASTAANEAGASIPGLGALDAAFTQLTKASMWRSLGWLALGVVVTAGGVVWWAKKEEGSIVSGLTGLKVGQKPSLQAPVIPLGLMMTGLYLCWFGVTYWEDTKTIWPSDPVKDILQGDGLPARQTDTSAAAILNASESANATASGQSGSGSAAVPAGVSGSAQDQARGLLSSHGWSASEFLPLVSLWNRESGWNAEARNPSSGAFGIAQALGHGVSGGAAPDGTNEYGGFGLSTAQAKAANSGSAYWQIVWGLNYVAATYGSPQSAWEHEASNGWY